MNSLVRSQQGMPQVGTRDGNWVWDGARWVCDPDCDSGFQPPVVTPAFFPPPVFSGPTSQPPWYPGANGGVSFGQTPPPNPVRGHFWWDGTTLRMFDGAAFVVIGGDGTVNGGGASGAGTVVISSTAPGNPVAGMQWWNGSVLQVWDGTSWKVIGPGMAAGPVPTTTEVFRIGNPSDLTIGTNWTVVPFVATPQVDPTLGWDPVSKKFTPKKGGMYLFTIRAYAASIALLKNDSGTLVGPNQDNWVAVLQELTPQFIVSVTGMTVMNGTTDYVRLFAFSADSIFHSIGQNAVVDGFLMP